MSPHTGRTSTVYLPVLDAEVSLCLLQAYKKNVEELIEFVDSKMLPPETASRMFKHVEFQARHVDFDISILLIALKC